MASSSSFSSPPPSSNFQSVFNAALEAYEKTTKSNLLAHPLAIQLQSCDSPAAILSLLQDLIQQLDQSRSRDERLRNWLDPTVNVLFALSATLGQGAGLIFSPANVIFTGIGVLLSAAKDVNASQDMLVDLFSSIEMFFKRLESYTEVPPTAAMTSIIIEIMVKVLEVVAIATKEIKERRSKKFVKRLLGKNNIEEALKRLDRLTLEEARMATAEVLKVTHRVDDKVTTLIDGGQSREKLQRWLTPPDPSTNHNIARKAHYKGTATWFFQGSIFEQWKSSPSLLWIHGKPGSGKSVLCSGIIADLMQESDAGSVTMVYFYCDFRDEDKQNCRNLLLSIISQLCARSNICCDIIYRIYSAHDNGTRKPSDDTLTNCLNQMISLPALGPVYLIIDALDECPNNSGMPTPREEVLDLVKDLVGIRLPNLHICLTSRPEIDIQTILEPLTSLRVSLHNQSGQKKDIEDYVSSVVSSDPKMRRWREEDRKLVIEMLSERADGMFRWVYCQLERLRHCLPPSVRVILDELPETLDETYERVLRDINKSNREHAHRLLHCLTVAIRPLRVEELAEVLAVDFDAARSGGIPRLNPHWRWADQHQAVLSTCSSLIAIIDDGDSQVVQFSHFSVKEFLTSDRLARSSDVSQYHIDLEPAHTILAQACLGVLLRLDDHDAGDIPLAKYGARHWVDHARFERVSSRVRDAMEYFFDSDKPHWAAWIRVYNIDRYWEWFSPDNLERDGSPLYYAALCGFYDLVQHLLGKHPEHINANGGRLVTPLVAALRGNYFEVAESLHRHGANVEVRGLDEGTPLQVACATGLVNITQWLLDRGADVNAHESEGWTALHYAAFYGDLKATRSLLERGADINSRNKWGEVPLHLAAGPCNPCDDQVVVMELLLDHGSDAKTQDKNGSTPLHHSSYRHKGAAQSGCGTVEGSQLLLKHGAQIDAKDDEGRTPLQVALAHERHEMVTFLSEQGTTVPD